MCACYKWKNKHQYITWEVYNYGLCLCHNDVTVNERLSHDNHVLEKVRSSCIVDEIGLLLSLHLKNAW